MKKAGDVGTSAVSSPVSGPSVSKGGGYTGLADMFDGGGPGRSGGPFMGGGLLSAIGNALTGNRGMGVGPEAGVGFAGYGYHDAQGNWVPASIDMRNGGGPGRAGNTFMGGGQYSALANMLGIRPMGYNDMRMTQEQADAFRASIPNKTPAMAALAPTTSPSPTTRPAGVSGVPALSPMNTAANDPFIGLGRTLDPLMELAPVGPYISQAPFVSGYPVVTYPSSSVRRSFR